MSLPRLTLQALEAFERVAQSGSMQIAAGEMDLSISAVSHHVARLEDQLGVILLDRSTRPFILTREGQQMLHHLSKGLFHLRRATSETEISGLLGARSLRIGVIEDFEHNVTPELAVVLARKMPRTKLTIRNILSHEATKMLLKGDIDVAVASDTAGPLGDVVCEPLVRDPYIISCPQDVGPAHADLLLEKTELPFLRFNPNHMIGQQIEGHLSRNRIALPNQFSFDSVQSIMAIISNGEGWSILTPLGYMRARNFAESVDLHPLPIAAFSRSVSMMARMDFDTQTLQAMARIFRQILARGAVDPACAAYPWLAETFTLLAPEH